MAIFIVFASLISFGLGMYASLVLQTSPWLKLDRDRWIDTKYSVLDDSFVTLKIDKIYTTPEKTEFKSYDFRLGWNICQTTHPHII